MEPSNTDAPEVLETPETEVEQPQNDNPTPEQIAEWRRKAEERDQLDEKNKQLFARAKKAETKDFLSPADIIALRDVHEEDIETIQEWAKFKNMSLAEARKDATLATILATKAEERRTAQAAHVAGGARAATTPSASDILAKAERGDLPDSDEEVALLAQAREDRLRKKR